MKILLISPFLPDPEAPAGAPRAIYDRVRLLCREHEVTVATLMEPDEGSSEVPRPLVDAPVRVYAMTRPAAAWHKQLRLAAGLLVGGRPVLVQEFGSSRLCGRVRWLVRGERFDVVMVEHALAAQYVECLGKDAPPVVFTDHDVRTSFPKGRASRPASLLRRLMLPLDVLDRALWRRYTRRAYRSAAGVTVPTEEDARLVRRVAPGVRVEVLPFGMAVPVGEAGGEREREPDTLLFVGNFDHPPNRDAAVWLGREIMPLVWARLPGARLWLVGRNPTTEVQALGGERVTVTGEVPSVREYLARCSLFVAPLRQGGGMRIKLIEALGAGTPVVTTTVGAQGLDAEAGRHLLVANTARDIAEAVVCALDDPALRARLGAAGRELVRSGLNEDERAARLNGLLESVAGERP
jgi:glycosyltransferase involved in cell wall biosynthesis